VRGVVSLAPVDHPLGPSLIKEGDQGVTG
jgi:hypothetical protein